MDAGEMPEGALRREISEELAMPINVHELLDIFPMVNQDQPSQGIVLVFRATPLDSVWSTAVAPEAVDGVAEARWFTVQGLAGELPVPLAFASTEVEVRRWVQESTSSGLQSS
jgi:ADP-ribose pyrophosphatase YjhB (NUDIX family)